MHAISSFQSQSRSPFSIFPSTSNMAEVSYLQPHKNDDGEYDDGDEVVVSFSSHNNWSHNPDAFDAYPSDLDFPSSDDFFCHTDRNNDSVLLNRENQVNFVIDMFHQRVEQSQSHLVIESGLRSPEYDFRMITNDLEVEFGLGFHVEVNNNRNDGDDNLGFVLDDCGDDFVVPRRTTGDQSSRSGGPEHFTVPDLGSDSAVAGGGDDDSNLRHSWDAFQLEDDYERGETNPNEDFEWEEVDGRMDDREVLNMIFESEPDDDTSDLPRTPRDSHESEGEQPHQWEVLLNVHNLDANPDLAAGSYDESNYAEYEMVVDTSSFGRPPASINVVKNLLSVVITDEDFEKNNILCAVCKDEIKVGLMAKQLPCAHRYHGDCILPWLGIRNTCPVCRHELPTDDPEYERRKAERGGGDQ